MSKKMVTAWLGGVLLIYASLSWSVEKVTVYAAASLSNVVEAIAEEYQSQHKVKVVTSFASSSTLARQIKEGAPAELFISADQQWMDYLADNQLIVPNSRVTLLGNQLVLIAPIATLLKPFTLSKSTDWQALLKGGRLAVGDPDHVPVGIYARQALEYLGAWGKVAPQMARANSVRAGMALVERGEAPLGIVYSSDAQISNKVKILAVFPAESHKPVEYPLAIIAGSSTPQAEAFSRYLQGPEAANLFKQFGFVRTQAVK